MTDTLSRSHEDATIERFQRDPELAAEYLDAIRQDGDERELLQALQRLARAFEGSGDDCRTQVLNALSDSEVERGTKRLPTAFAFMKPTL